MADVRIGVVGCAGRMGRMLVRQIDETAGAVPAGGIEVVGNPALGQDIGELAGIGGNGLSIGDDPATRFAEPAVRQMMIPGNSVPWRMRPDGGLVDLGRPTGYREIPDPAACGRRRRS